MCGINAIYSLRKGKDYENLIRDMTDKLSHRGPDQEGIFCDNNRGIFLGHRRLSIIDLSDKGNQPMTDEKESVVIVFNGEIYNYLNLKEELMEEYTFKSTTDTEVLLYAYKKWGLKFLDRIDGMFSFVIFDKNKNQVLAVRDRLGIKPLYYTILKDKVLISSEVKSILLCKDYTKKLDLKAVSAYLSYRYPVSNKTFFKGVNSLEPGHFLLIRNNKVKKKEYWDLNLERIKNKGEKYYKKKCKKLFSESINKRLMSDVPLGAYLSGGLDSSAVVAEMSSKSEKPVKTFTIGFDEKNYNEFKYAKKVSAMYNTDHKEILLSSRKYIKTIKKLIKFKDAPLGVPNEVPLYLMSRELKKEITVVLSGEGADEIFSGYGRIYRSPDDYKKIRLLNIFPILNSVYPFSKMTKNLLLKYGTLNFNSEFKHFMTQYNYFPLEEKNRLYTEKMKRSVDGDKNIRKLFKHYFYKFDVPYHRRITLIFEKLHLPGLLQRVDNSTMATSVEARVPFVDHKLVEFMLNTPTKHKLRWVSFKDRMESYLLNSDQISEKKDITKYLLREIMVDKLPNEVIKRTKKGFPVPLNTWFKKDFVELAKKELLSDKSKIKTIFDQKKLTRWIDLADSKNFGHKLWMILNLEYFLREYF